MPKGICISLCSIILLSNLFKKFTPLFHPIRGKTWLVLTRFAACFTPDTYICSVFWLLPMRLASESDYFGFHFDTKMKTALSILFDFFTVLTAKEDVLASNFSYAFCAFSNASFLSGCSSPLVCEEKYQIWQMITVLCLTNVETK